MNTYKEEVGQTCRSKGWNVISIDTLWLLFSEEIGELAKAIRNYKKIYSRPSSFERRKHELMLELGDVFSYLFQLGYMLNIDMDEMWALHRKKMISKNYFNSSY